MTRVSTKGWDAAPPTHPLLRWHGGKWRLADWIIAHLPPHRVYVEPFCGAASVLLRKPRPTKYMLKRNAPHRKALFRASFVHFLINSAGRYGD